MLIDGKGGVFGLSLFYAAASTQYRLTLFILWCIDKMHAPKVVFQ
jgi:hypothetical protein